MELSSKRIAELRKKIQKQNSVFKDKRYLDLLFLPSKIIGRENQAKQLLQYLDSLNKGFVVPIISVYGRSGSGKSTIVKFVCQNMSDTISYAFVNLRKAKTIFGCANLILGELDVPNLKSAQGLSLAVDSMEERIKKILADEKKKLFVLVLDEYDVIFSDRRGGSSDFVYKLLTLEENLREKGLWLCIITISNNALSQYDLDGRVKSRMGNSELFFEPYVEKDVFYILKDRAEKAFKNMVPDEILKYCAKLSSEDHGDARQALDLLRVAGEQSDGKNITKKDVDNATQQVQKDRIETIVSQAPYQTRTIIASICTLSHLRGDPWCATSSIYKKYRDILSKETKPLSYRRISELLVEIENSGLVEPRTISRGRQGYGKEYKLKQSPKLVGPLVSEKWWQSIQRQKETHDQIQQLALHGPGTKLAESVLKIYNRERGKDLDL